MATVFLLGPGYFEGEDEPRALEQRRAMAASMPEHRVLVMEDEAGRPGEADVEKFHRLCLDADTFLVWLPRNGRLPTVFAELVILRQDERHAGKAITILHQAGVLDTSRGTFEVLVDEGQIAYLRDLPAVCRLRCFRYEDAGDLEHLVGAYGDGQLEDAD